MILICPNCQAKSKLKASQVPKQGAWAKCPKCSEKFFVKPQGQATSLNLNEDKKNITPNKSVYRTAETQDLIDKLKKQSTLPTNSNTTPKREYIDEALDVIIVFPRATIPPITCGFIILIFFLILFLFIASTYFSIQNQKQEQNAKVHLKYLDKAIQPIYSATHIANDVETLRRDFNNKFIAQYNVNTSGIESRLAKYYLNLLDPEGCQEISSIKVTGLTHSQGFQFETECYDLKMHDPILKFNVDHNNSKIMHVVLLNGSKEINSTNIDLWANISQKRKEELEERKKEALKQFEAEKATVKEEDAIFE